MFYAFCGFSHTLNKNKKQLSALLSSVLCFLLSTMAEGAVYLTFVAALCVALVTGQGTYDVDDSVGLGRKFDGIGGLSGGGVTILCH